MKFLSVLGTIFTIIFGLACLIVLVPTIFFVTLAVSLWWIVGLPLSIHVEKRDPNGKKYTEHRVYRWNKRIQ
mgnify:CR=1 FL=1